MLLDLELQCAIRGARKHRRRSLLVLLLIGFFVRHGGLSQIGFTSKTSADSPRSGFGAHFVRPIGPLHLPTDERAIVFFGQESLMTAANVRCFTILATGALCRLAPRDPIDHRLLGLLSRHRAATWLARS